MTDVRFVHVPSKKTVADNAIMGLGVTDIRLALPSCTGTPAKNAILGRHLPVTDVRLVHTVGAQGDNALLGRQARQYDGERKYKGARLPSLLVSYFYCNGWIEKTRQAAAMRDWVLDSGAFSAFNSGAVIVLEEYIEYCHAVLKEASPPVEVFALDVINDPDSSARNTQLMWDAGIEAIPVYHLGEPSSVLRDLVKSYPKVGIGGMSQLRGSEKVRFVEAVFSTAWPAKLHGLAAGDEKIIMMAPWHSVDASSWQVGPASFASWKRYGAMSVRGSNHFMHRELDWWMELEAKAKSKWGKVLAGLD